MENKLTDFRENVLCDNFGVFGIFGFVSNEESGMSG